MHLNYKKLRKILKTIMKIPNNNNQMSTNLQKACYIDWLKGYLLATIPTTIIGFFPLLTILIPSAITIENKLIGHKTEFGIPIIILISVIILIIISASLAFTSLFFFKYISNNRAIFLITQNSLLGILIILSLKNIPLAPLPLFGLFNIIFLYVLVVFYIYLAIKLVTYKITTKLKSF